MLSTYALALQRSLIILVGLTMTLFCEKMLISNKCIPTWFHVQFDQKTLDRVYNITLIKDY